MEKYRNFIVPIVVHNTYNILIFKDCSKGEGRGRANEYVIFGQRGGRVGL